MVKNSGGGPNLRTRRCQNLLIFFEFMKIYIFIVFKKQICGGLNLWTRQCLKLFSMYMFLQEF